LQISSVVPPKDKITLDIDQLQIDDQKIDIQGTTKTSDGIDLLVTELKKVDCFKEVNRGPTDTNADGTKKFKLTITAACM
jgi:curli biogenesis system outer membrane secretion channel CsgG